MFIIAHNIRSLYNVGSLFRSAEAFGIEKIYLTGYTGHPPRKEIHKTALGTEHLISWEYQEDIFSLIDTLKEEHILVYGLETAEEAQPLDSVQTHQHLALVLGNEVSGIEQEVRDMLDGLLVIPMKGRKKSINVSVAAGIAMFVLQ